MKIFFVAMLAALFLGVLWGPALLVARRFQRAGDATALRWLRIVWPLQLVSTLALVVLADAAGLADPAGLFAAITFGTGIAGAAVLALLRWLAGLRMN